MHFSGARPARARPRGSVRTIPAILTDAASSDSAVQEFEVRRLFVLKSCINIPGGIGRTLQELSSLGVSGATEFPLLESQLSLFSLPFSHQYMTHELDQARPFPP
eukprot:COSAG02_NODE_150_length_33596_cov_61.953966_28_plen_105_part_00